VVPIVGNVSLGVGALTYAGQYNITAVADREACPDIESFADGVRRSLDRLAVSVLVGSATESGLGPGHAWR
jgi:diacylglycerol O-acyltransferase